MTDAIVNVEIGSWKCHLMCRQNPAAFLCTIYIAILASKGNGAVRSMDTHNDRFVAKTLWQDNGWVHVEFVGRAKDGAERKVVERTASQFDIVDMDMLGFSQRVAKLDPGCFVHMESADVFAGCLVGSRVHIKVVAYKDRTIFARVDSMGLFSTKALRGFGKHNVQHFVGSSKTGTVDVLLLLLLLLLWDGRRWRWR